MSKESLKRSYWRFESAVDTALRSASSFLLWLAGEWYSFPFLLFVLLVTAWVVWG